MKKNAALALFAVLSSLGCTPAAPPLLAVPTPIPADDITLPAAPEPPAPAPAAPAPAEWTEPSPSDPPPFAAISSAKTNTLAAAPQTKTKIKTTKIPFDFAHVLHDGGLWIVLDTNPDPSWASGDPSLLSKASPVAVRRDANTPKIPLALLSTAGRRVDLLKNGRTVCQATITNFALLGRVEPYFGTRAEWEGAGEENKTPLTDAAIAEQAWQLSEGNGRVLAAELSDEKGAGCAEATWARDASFESTRTAAAKPARPAIYKRAIAAMRNLSTYAELQKSHDALPVSQRRSGPWDEVQGADVVVSEIRFSENEDTWVWASARAEGACDEFSGALSALWKLHNGPLGPELSLLYEEAGAPNAAPEAAVELDSDRHVDLLFPGARLRPHRKEAPSPLNAASTYTLETISFPFLDCPC